MFESKNEETINLAYNSKYNRKRKNQVVLLMITNDEKNDEIDENDKWHYIALKTEHTDDGFNRPIKSLSKLFRGITSIIMEIFTPRVVCIHFELIMYLKNMTEYVKTINIASNNAY